jgi:hypothetical protein
MISTKRPSLAILTHSTDDFWKGRPLIQLMIPRWEAMGFKVAVVTDVDRFVPADVALLHVDLSVVPDLCRRLAERYPLVLNGGVLDIRKRRFSQLLVDRQAPCSGKVIVKTDLNYGGWGEFRRGVVESPIGRLLLRRYSEESVCHKLGWLEARKPWRWRRMLPVGHYPVYAGPDRVPGGVWANPNLIVERFVSERDGNNYCCRHWLFFGDQEVTRRVTSPHPVVKAEGKLEPTSEPVPEELRTIRGQLGFDYGKFDYGIVDGKVVLYDVNRTPGASADPRRHAETIDVLSEGLRAALKQRQ